MAVLHRAAGADEVLRTGADEVLRTVHDLAGQFAAGAAERDAQRLLPREQIRALADAGVLAVTVPERFGGPGLGAADLARIVAALAAADPSIAQIPQSHFTFLEALRRQGAEDLQERIFGAVLRGAVLANAQTERGGATVTDDATTVRRAAGGLVLHGVKYYCTGSAFADLLAVRAVTESDGGTQRKVIVYLPADTPGVSIDDDWDGMGQRTTSSGTVVFDDVPVSPDQLLDFTALLSRPSTYGARAQLYHAAIDTGLARGALTAAAEAASRARPWFEAGVERAVDDPYLIAQAGELEVAVRSAQALLAAAGAAIDAADAGGSAAPAAVAEASLATAAAKVAAGRAARETGAALFDFGGTRAAAAPANLSRYWRDARTHTLHDPERWKLHHLGRWALTGSTPPSHTSL
ncbi:acyl-CoA dehydrogenase family protein [Gordonia sp. VNK21]|uniref:acyl-CoA dehydrogenase family protein n=1 Tax=Gordonia sp. VNK21 TaxID=3382483 RepID=UPI0038D4D2D1